MKVYFFNEKKKGGKHDSMICPISSSI